MENALQSLTNTLDAINSRQAAARKRARKGGDATPFTSAVLNRERLDIYTYIRDADHQTEASLFWYPPVPQSASSSRAGPSSSNHRSVHAAPGRSNAAGHNADDANEADLLLAPRLPEPRHVAPPTPLRNINASAQQGLQGQNDQSVDPRVLLLAAQRLNDTCGRATRARKHIKGLIKTHETLIQDIKKYEQKIRQSEAELNATAQGKPIGTVQTPTTDADLSRLDDAAPVASRVQAQLSEVEESIQKEELEILALGEMIEELRQARSDWQKQELERQQNAQAALQAERAQPKQQPPRRSLVRMSLVRPDPIDLSQPAPEHEVGSAPQNDDEQSLDGTIDLTHNVEPAEEEILQVHYSSEPQYAEDLPVVDSAVPGAHHDASIFQSLDEDDTTDDVTVQQHHESEVLENRHDVADTSAAIDPVEVTEQPAPEAMTEPTQEAKTSHFVISKRQSSDELERVTRKVWEVFGDALRSVAPDRESADYFDTLDILKSLMTGGDKPNAGDYSVGSVQTSSTISTANSEASAAVSAQLTPDVLMTAFVIFQMLVSEEPHRMNIDELKVRSHEWWSASGKQVWLHARSHDDHEMPGSIEAFEDGQNLARKATYGMISKQLFAIKRQKGVGLVGFA